MHTPPLFVLDGWSALIKSKPGSCKLLSSLEIFELKEIISQRGIKYHLVKVLIFGNCELEYYLDFSGKLKDFKKTKFNIPIDFDHKPM